MAKQQTDHLFQLIKSLSKSEKRNFKLYVKRNSSSEGAKFLQLFDLIDKQDEYDEKLLMKKAKDIKKVQLSNLKAHLYKQLLTSLRLNYKNNDIAINIREQIDYAKILYNRGLYMQSLKILDKAKAVAYKYSRLRQIKTIIEFEKRIESQFITRSISSRAEDLTQESKKVDIISNRISVFSDMAILLYGLFLKKGHTYDGAHREEADAIMEAHMPMFEEQELCFPEKLNLYHAKQWYYFLTQDFFNAYRYCYKWVSLFDEEPLMKPTMPDMYLKGLDNMLNTCFLSAYYGKFEYFYKVLEQVGEDETLMNIPNIKILYFSSWSNHYINYRFIDGEFEKGIEVIPKIEEGLQEHKRHLDKQIILSLYYKIACLYFGNADYKLAIKYLNLIITERNTDLRGDIHAFARLLIVICYFELQEYDYLEYLLKSTYRYLMKEEELYEVQRVVLRFIRRLPFLLPDQLMDEFKKYRALLEELRNDPRELRPFLYLDLIIWLDHKIEQKSIAQLSQERYKMAFTLKEPELKNS
ncbi:hypothetical protein [Persicobacter psychrovividus]|uniref:Tetratricopeptide repeat protein n=1 Tax=Persicobacter psychrovividus TaxID=387638 RepID=A0ABN6L5S9_9BACT|nr:hypothetical protein PEPS_08020 [Persicobacter psychrovividus]